MMGVALAVKPRSVLIVDDDQLVRNALAREFRHRGCSVRTAADYNEAVSSARSGSPELAVVDLQMPGRNGLDVLAALKEVDPQMSVVILTGYGTIPAAVDAMRIGAVDFLSKPLAAADILEAVERGESLMRDDEPSLAQHEWEHIMRVLDASAGNISEAARRLGIHRRTLQRKLLKHEKQDGSDEE
jgi:two-component system response regulator RegA